MLVIHQQYLMLFLFLIIQILYRSGIPIKLNIIPSYITDFFICFLVAPTDESIPNCFFLSDTDIAKLLYITIIDPIAITIIRITDIVITIEVNPSIPLTPLYIKRLLLYLIFSCKSSTELYILNSFAMVSVFSYISFGVLVMTPTLVIESWLNVFSFNKVIAPVYSGKYPSKFCLFIIPNYSKLFCYIFFKFFIILIFRTCSKFTSI